MQTSPHVRTRTYTYDNGTTQTIAYPFVVSLHWQRIGRRDHYFSNLATAEQHVRNVPKIAPDVRVTLHDLHDGPLPD